MNPLILCLEASIPGCGSAAVGDGEVCVREEMFGDGGRNAGRLFSSVDGLVRDFEGRLGEIRVGLGPGSFSGVRQILALASGLSQGLGIPVKGACSHRCLGLVDADCFVVQEAGRGDVYFSKLAAGQIASGPILISQSKARELCSGENLSVYAAGQALNGWELPSVEPRAKFLLGLEDLYFEPQDLLPIYLREPNITKSKDPMVQPGAATR